MELATLSKTYGNFYAPAFAVRLRGRDLMRDLLLAVPSHALRALFGELAPRLTPALRLAWASKGFELDTGLLPHQVAAAVLGAGVPMAVPRLAWIRLPTMGLSRPPSEPGGAVTLVKTSGPIAAKPR